MGRLEKARGSSSERQALVAPEPGAMPDFVFYGVFMGESSKDYFSHPSSMTVNMLKAFG